MMDYFKPTVFIIEDDIAICESLKWLLSSVNLKAELFHNGFDFLNKYHSNLIGCLIIDVRLPGMSGLELQQQLIERKSSLPIIMISGHGDVNMAVRAMKAGAKDFILKPFNNDMLLEQIQNTIMENHAYHQIDPRFIDGFIHLTPRENEIVELMVEGKSNKQMSANLKIAVSTVEKHRANIMSKTQVKSLAHFIRNYFLMRKK